jgi:hypothetical protein
VRLHPLRPQRRETGPGRGRVLRGVRRGRKRFLKKVLAKTQLLGYSVSTMNEVANTILAQLGGNKFLAMTGAKSLLGSEDRLSFRLPYRVANKGIAGVVVRLMPDDTYTVDFLGLTRKAWVLRVGVIETREGVYCDNLQEVFTEVTGLDTHL